MSEDAQRTKKRRRSFTSDPISEGYEGDGSDGHCEQNRPRTSGSPPRTNEVPSQEPLTLRHRIVIPGKSWFTRARRTAMIDEGEDGGFGKAGSRKGQPE